MYPLFEAPYVRPPIIIGGCGRSGSSLLLSMLSAHPAIQAASRETEAFCPGIWEGRYDPGTRFELQRLARALEAEPQKDTAHRRLEKSPKNICALGTILKRLQPDVRFLNIVRDGRDVITSRHPTRRREQFWVSPQRWLSDVNAGKPYDEHPQVLVVRYEDLVNDSSNALQRICRFLDEPFVPEIEDWHAHATIRQHVAWKDEVQPLYAHSIGRWNNAAYKDLIEHFLQLPGVLELLKHYGYPV